MKTKHKYKALKVGKSSITGNIYSESECIKAVNEYFNEKVAVGIAFGTLGPYDALTEQHKYNVISTDNASHKITDVFIEEDWVWVEFQTIATPNGKLLDEMFNSKADIQIEPILYGKVNTNKEVEDLRFISFGIGSKR